MAFSCNKGTAKGSHDTGDVRSGCVNTGDAFKTSQYSIVVEGSTLYHDMATQVFCVRKLDYLI